MVKYSLIRLLRAILAFWGVLTIVFVLPRLVGDPVKLMAPLDIDRQDIEIIRQNMGLDKPIIEQYTTYVRRFFVGDLGYSYYFRTPAKDIILDRFPATIQLAVAALLWELFLGIPLGIISAIKRGSVLDQICRTAAVLGQSVPSYFTAIILLLFFGVYWQVLPARGPVDGLGSLQELLLPSLALGIAGAGPTARLTRSAMLEVLTSDYITMARMKGLKEKIIVWKHALRNALIPVLTFLSLSFAGLLGGVVIIESIFSWPGLGKAVLAGVFSWDFPLVQAATILGSSVFILTNYLVDITYGLVDPRVRY